MDVVLELVGPGGQSGVSPVFISCERISVCVGVFSCMHAFPISGKYK